MPLSLLSTSRLCSHTKWKLECELSGCVPTGWAKLQFLCLPCWKLLILTLLSFLFVSQVSLNRVCLLQGRSRLLVAHCCQWACGFAFSLEAGLAQSTPALGAQLYLGACAPGLMSSRWQSEQGNRRGNCMRRRATGAGLGGYPGAGERHLGVLSCSAPSRRKPAGQETV